MSTCFIQLWMAGVLLGGVIALFLHPDWWSILQREKWWPISIGTVFVIQQLTKKILNTYVTDGTTIKRPFVWMFAYVALSAGYLVVCSGTCLSVPKCVCRSRPHEQQLVSVSMLEPSALS